MYTLFLTVFVANISFFLAYNFGEDYTGGCKATQIPKESEPKWSQQVSIEMNTVGIDCLFQ